MPICHIIAILESEKDCEEIRHAPQLLYVLREQNRDLKEPLYDCCHEGLCGDAQCLNWYRVFFCFQEVTFYIFLYQNHIHT